MTAWKHLPNEHATIVLLHKIARGLYTLAKVYCHSCWQLGLQCSAITWLTCQGLVRKPGKDSGCSFSV